MIIQILKADKYDNVYYVFFEDSIKNSYYLNIDEKPIKLITIKKTSNYYLKTNPTKYSEYTKKEKDYNVILLKSLEFLNKFFEEHLNILKTIIL